jgi:hypothetical protein
MEKLGKFGVINPVLRLACRYMSHGKRFSPQIIEAF